MGRLSLIHISSAFTSVVTSSEAGIVEDGKVNISVTTFVPAPEEVTTEVKAEDVTRDVPKSIPLAAAKFEPSGLKFKKSVTISIPNPVSYTHLD